MSDQASIFTCAPWCATGWWLGLNDLALKDAFETLNVPKDAFEASPGRDAVTGGGRDE